MLQTCAPLAHGGIPFIFADFSLFSPPPHFSLSVTFVLLGVGIPAMLPASGKKNSKYISMIEGRHGHAAAHDDHAAAAHH